MATKSAKATETPQATVDSTDLVAAEYGGGTTSINASTLGEAYIWNSYSGCYMYTVQLQGSGTVKVQVPTSLKLIGTISSGVIASCTVTINGPDRAAYSDGKPLA